MMNFLIAAARHVLRAASSSCPILLGIARLFGLYAIVEERTLPRLRAVRQGARRSLDEPGLHFLPLKLGLARVHRQLARAAATCSTCGSTRNTCAASRSTPRKARRWASASGTRCSSAIPVAYLFKNTDPRGSLRANVSNATVRCLSNMPLADDAGEPPRDEPDRARRSLAEVARVGLQARLGLHPQGPLPRRRHDPADRGEGGEPAAPGDLGHQAGRREPGEHHHQHRRARRRRSSSPRPRPSARRSSARRSTGSARTRRSRRALFEILETQKLLEGEARDHARAARQRSAGADACSVDHEAAARHAEHMKRGSFSHETRITRICYSHGTRITRICLFTGRGSRGPALTRRDLADL